MERRQIGTVKELFRYPVKSMLGERLERLEIGERGRDRRSRVGAARKRERQNRQRQEICAHARSAGGIRGAAA